MKIFDGLFHPSFDQETELLNLIKGLKNRYNVHGALAVPLPGQVNDINSYIASCSKFEFFKPVGLFDPHLKKVEEQVKNFKEARCIAIKIHPRFSCWDWTSSRGLKVFGDLIDKCEQYELPILKQQDVEKIIISDSVIKDGKPPMLMYKTVDKKTGA